MHGTVTYFGHEADISIWFVVLLGLANSLVWAGIWPLALDGLGRFTKLGASVLIMGLCGNAVLPLVYGWFADMAGERTAYWVLLPCYGYLMFYAFYGHWCAAGSLFVHPFHQKQVMNFRKTKIFNGRIITPYRVINGGTVLTEGTRILAVAEDDIPVSDALEIDAQGLYISPGFIDIHVHGGGDSDFMDGDIQAFLQVADTHLRFGTTAMTPPRSAAIPAACAGLFLLMKPPTR